MKPMGTRKEVPRRPGKMTQRSRESEGKSLTTNAVWERFQTTPWKQMCLTILMPWLATSLDRTLWSDSCKHKFAGRSPNWFVGSAILQPRSAILLLFLVVGAVAIGFVTSHAMPCHVIIVCTHSTKSKIQSIWQQKAHRLQSHAFRSPQNKEWNSPPFIAS